MPCAALRVRVAASGRATCRGRTPSASPRAGRLRPRESGSRGRAIPVRSEPPASPPAHACPHRSPQRLARHERCSGWRCRPHRCAMRRESPRASRSPTSLRSSPPVRQHEAGHASRRRRHGCRRPRPRHPRTMRLSCSCRSWRHGSASSVRPSAQSLTTGGERRSPALRPTSRSPSSCSRRPDPRHAQSPQVYPGHHRAPDPIRDPPFGLVDRGRATWTRRTFPHAGGRRHGDRRDKSRRRESGPRRRTEGERHPVRGRRTGGRAAVAGDRDRAAADHRYRRRAAQGRHPDPPRRRRTAALHLRYGLVGLLRVTQPGLVALVPPDRWAADLRRAMEATRRSSPSR